MQSMNNTLALSGSKKNIYTKKVIYTHKIYQSQINLQVTPLGFLHIKPVQARFLSGPAMR